MFGSLGVPEVVMLLLVGAAQVAFLFFIVYWAVRLALRHEGGAVDRFEQFNAWFNGAVVRALPFAMVVAVFSLMATQMPALMALLVSLWGAMLVYSIRKQTYDIVLASAAYFLITGTIALAG